MLDKKSLIDNLIFYGGVGGSVCVGGGEGGMAIQYEIWPK